VLQAGGVPPGYSGSAFARVEAADGGVWLLRRWPTGFGEERLRFVHGALVESRSRGFSGVPALATTITGDSVASVGGNLYDAQSWLGGEPLGARGTGEGQLPNLACGVSAERLLVLAEALARFHQSTAGLVPLAQYRAPSLTERLRRLEAETSERRAHLLRAVRSRGTDEELETARLWLTLLPRALDAARRSAARVPPDGTSEVLCHADLWPTHVRFESTSFAGFVDFESLAFASPALDLAQLLGHFGGWEAARSVLRSYATAAPIKVGDVMSLAPEVVADLAAEGLWALEGLYGDPSSDRAPQQAKNAHWLNLGLLFDPLQKAADSCAGPSGLGTARP
jgi:Ser/Thr protein kinase RdoA (MazF antagonist)